jgi:hypothetical protein
MAYSNLISTSITGEDIGKILKHITAIDQLLKGLINLSKEEKLTMFQTGSNTTNFVLKALEYAEKYPEMVPGDVDVEEIKKDVELIISIQRIIEPLKALVKKLEDSAVLAGNEAYVPSMALYNAVERACRDGKINADETQRVAFRKKSDNLNLKFLHQQN